MQAPARPARRALAAGIGAAALVGLAGLAGLSERLDLPLRDAAAALLPVPDTADIVLVEIDEGALAARGRWPWPRRLLAELVERIAEARPGAIGLAVLLLDPGPADPAGDARLVEAVARAGNVVLPLFVGADAPGGLERERLPMAGLATAAAGLGHVEVPVDRDGLTRGAFPRAGLGSAWPALALCLEAVARAVPRPCRPEPRGPASLRWQRAPPVLLPLAGGAPRRIGAAELLARADAATALAGAIVLVGPSAAGIDAAVRVAGVWTNEAIPALLYHARVLAAWRDGRTIGLPPPWLAIALAVLTSGLVAALLAGVRRPLPTAAALVTGAVLASLALLLAARIWISPLPALLGVLLVAGLRPLLELEGVRRRLAATRARHDLILESVADAVIATDPQGRIRYVNAAAEELAGLPRARLLARRLADALRLDAPREETGRLADRLAAGGGRLALIARPDGIERTVRVVERPLEGERGGRLLVLTDVSEPARLARELDRLAGHDPLTGLLNRRLLLERLERAVARARRTGGTLGLLFIDLDRFKTVNDALGHGAGDALLVEIAHRLRARIRATDTAARLGGDEFVVLLEPLRRPTDAGRVAREIMTAITHPVALDGREIVVGASVGIATFPADGTGPVELLGRADAAMYRAKSEGGGQLAFWGPAMHKAALERLELDRDLRRALRRNQLVLHYQPTVELDSGRIVGAEALLRWHHPSRGLVPPGRFVGLAEETGLIVPIGGWILETACAQAVAWAAAGGPASVAVNVSPRQLHRSDLVATVRNALAASGLLPDRLVLELTESSLLEDVDSAAATLAALKTIGVRIALDDFGTGYASVAHLNRLPLDLVKIDRAFVQRIGRSFRDEAIVRAIQGLADTLGLDVVAEGVEERAQLAFLRSCGCRHAQGYLFGRPAPAEELGREPLVTVGE